MAGHDGGHVHPQHAVERGDPAIEVAIAEPRETPVEEKIAHEDDAGLFDVNDDVAVAMRRPPVVDPHGVGRQYELHPVGKSLRRRHDRQRRRAAHALGEPAALTLRHQLLEIAAEEHPDLRQRVGDRRAPGAQWPQLVLERLHRLLVRDDRHVGKGDVAGDVIEMEMRIDEGADRRLERGAQGAAEFFAERAILLGVDDDQAKRRLDRTRV